MMFHGKSAIVTGGGQGIGRAIAEALAKRGARIVVGDLNANAVRSAAREVGGIGLACDVRDPEDLARLVHAARAEFGGIDIICSNAGFARGETDGPVSASDSHWQDSWDVHVMAHLRLARLVLPEMLDRGSGCIINVASAAGLLSQIGDAAYSATKHAAVSLAQSLAIDYGDAGIRVAVVCPQYVATPLLGYDENSIGDGQAMLPEGVLRPADVAAATLQGLEQGRFLILPHEEVAGYFCHRAGDMDRWIRGMQKLRRRIMAEAEGTDPASLHRFI